ncbi:MAG: iron-sulfur cluster-binding protein [Candidatus Thermofonsia Clade 3 bacterium]|uniref:Iron-sulfur cluster-binding protein n=1 Tax=Candidatus Thermofonsia Clade 3 bacterium TaxID=2364212 RepID=A0A2M8QAN3_9CHLR|nr:MAG: iron-sulfur cluster-binding protein [Candidatus Thermofonsia Clade 3 bacterium]
MSRTAQFSQAVTVALSDIQLQTALDRGTTRGVNARIAAMVETTDADALRRQARLAREHALNHLPDLLEQLERNVIANGGHVLWARDAAELNQVILDLCQKHGVRCVTKGKSMVTEESELNHALEAHGIEVTESDLGEYIIQLAGETPSHIVFPMLHKTKEATAQLLHDKLGMPMTDRPEEMTRFVRGVMRRKYLEADMGISGVNFAIAETGTIATVENEGNNRLSTSAPRVHVAVMGVEKVIATWEDYAILVQLLARSATGQRLSVYNNLMSGPRRPDEPDGPEVFYLIIMDNGRSHILGSEYTESLACIRCGACLNACPVYQNIGGHAYGWVYPGPIGSIISPLLLGPTHAPELPYASSLCGACQAACPVEINIPDMLLKLRRDLVQAGDATLAWRAGMRLWRQAMLSPALYRSGGWLASLATQMLANAEGKIESLPPPLKAWTDSRDFPAFAKQPFRERLKQRRRSQARPGVSG